MQITLCGIISTRIFLEVLFGIVQSVRNKNLTSYICPHRIAIVIFGLPIELFVFLDPKNPSFYREVILDNGSVVRLGNNYLSMCST